MIEIEILTTTLGCSKCERAMQVINTVVNKYKGKIKVVETDVMKNPDKLIEFGLMTTPAIFINGKLAFEGAPSEKKLNEKIQEALR